MAFSLKGDPDKRLARDLEAARASRDNLIERLAAAELLIPERKAAAQRLAVDGANDSALDASEAEVRKAQDRVTTLAAALEEIRTQIVALEKEEVERADKKQRQATAAEIEEIKVEFNTAAGTNLNAAIARAIDASRRMSDVVLDAHPLTALLMNVAADLGPAVAFIAHDAEARAKAVIAGTAPPTLGKAPPPVLVVDMPKPARQGFFVLQPGTFVDDTGAIRRVPRYSFAELNPQQAAHAIRMGGVCEPADPRVKEFKKLRAGATQQPPEPHLCQDWDSGSPPRGDAELVIHSKFVQSSPFQPLDRGRPYMAQVRVTPAVASRAEDENE
jgi:hypothetical protein